MRKSRIKSPVVSNGGGYLGSQEEGGPLTGALQDTLWSKSTNIPHLFLSETLFC